MVDYFHDFFLRGFIMAKYWGHEVPKYVEVPSATITSPGLIPSPGSASIGMGSPVGQTPTAASQCGRVPGAPTMLCRWAIHVPREQMYEDVLDADSAQAHDRVDPPQPCFQEALQESILSSNFTDTSVDNLPLTKDLIVGSLQADPNAIVADTWKLAIMSGNYELLRDLGKKHKGAPPGVEAIYPFHLAAAYLDGSQTCCIIFEELSERFPPFQHNIDDLEYTIFDALMVSVLRSHTQIDPEKVSQRFRSTGRFPGEEKDICGRWDADMPALRELHRQGRARIPSKWKHPFCHTSAQAICHSLLVVYGSPLSPKINTLGELFLHQCTKCGIKTKLGPLHILVKSAFYMSKLGMEGETLFGCLAVAVCLLSLGADPCLKLNISNEIIWESDESQNCRHSPKSPAQLMRALSIREVENWSEALQTGWNCLYQTLARAERQSGNVDSVARSNFETDIMDTDPNPESLESCEVCEVEDDSGGIHGEWLGLTCNEPRIGTLWALIQVELLTYRRLSIEDKWISTNFWLEEIAAWMTEDSEVY